MANKDPLTGIAKVEGANTGQPTNLNSSALGKYQMIAETRKRMYKRLGYTDIEGAEREYKRNPSFEKRVADEYRDELDAQIPKSVTGKQREHMLAKGWYTGDVNYPDDKVPNPEAGNKLTAGEYASKSTGVQSIPSTSKEVLTYQGKIPETKLYTSGEFTGQRKYPPMTRMSGADFNQKPSITAKPIDMQDPKVTAMLDPYKKESKPRMDMAGTISSTAPYISNVYNAFQKPAPVPQPVYNKPISLQRIDMNNDRYEANKDYRADILNADRTLDGNTSVGVKQFAKAQKFSNMSKINQQERNENLAISNKEIGINAGIQQGNNEMLYNYRTLGAERQNAIRTQQSANFANAADKFVAQQGVKNQYALEDRKLDILENTDEYGTNKRLMKKLKQPEEKKMGGSLGKYSAGSFMKKLKTVY